jgi:hypothetical protein
MPTVRRTSKPDESGIASSRKLAPDTLWAQVLTTRASLVARQQHPHSDSLTEARLAFVNALEAYSESLLDRFRPIPPALRDELRIQRALCPWLRCSTLPRSW